MLDYKSILVTALLSATINNSDLLCKPHNDDFLYCHPLWVKIAPGEAQYHTILEVILYRDRWPDYEFFRENEQWEKFVTKVIDRLTYQRKLDDDLRARYGTFSKEIAEKAAQWWANKLKGDVDNMDRYDEAITGMGKILKMTQQLIRKMNPTRVDRFQEILTNRLQQEIANPWGFPLRVDYSPEELLKECWILSSDSRNDDGLGQFPFKTEMMVYKDHITVGEETI